MFSKRGKLNFGSVMYTLCNEEPLWMSLCLKGTSGSLQYKGSWKKTVLHKYASPHMQLLVLKSNYYSFRALNFSFCLAFLTFELGI